MKKANGALEVDTTNITIDEAVDTIVNKFKELV
jgi:cytidylate kinase